MITASDRRPRGARLPGWSRGFAIADEFAGELFAEGSPADLVDRYARKLPLSVICELLGLPLSDRPKFIAWASGFTRFTGTIGFISLIPNILAMRRYLEKQLEAVWEHEVATILALGSPWRTHGTRRRRAARSLRVCR